MEKYDLYVAGDCISQYESYEEAQKAFYEQVRENPDCPIDILTEDGETSLLAYDEETQQVYDYNYKNNYDDGTKEIDR